MPNNLTAKAKLKENVWLLGAGGMSVDYAKVLRALLVDFVVIGRGDASAEEFEKKTGILVVRGGVDQHLTSGVKAPDYAIVSVGVSELKAASLSLINFGVKNILVEKPAGLNLRQMRAIMVAAKRKRSRVYVAYNRRFYAAAKKASELIKADGGVTSLHFEFTEWSHEIEKLIKAPGEKESWFFDNSSHVSDLAFFLCGRPKKINCYTAGALKWHPAASIFAGSGVTDRGALFSYHADWHSPGRWGIEIMTGKHRLIFRPLEKLQVQEIGSLNAAWLDLDDKLDRDFKPGLYEQVKNFLNQRTEQICTIDEQCLNALVYNKMANYR